MSPGPLSRRGASLLLLALAPAGAAAMGRRLVDGGSLDTNVPAVVRVGVLLDMFGTASTGHVPFVSHRRNILAVYQALKELNSKVDGVADDLLPRTTILFAFRDSKCDTSHALMGALHLIYSAFEGRGVDAIIGARCSGASIAAAQISSATTRVPLISPSSTSPALSDGLTYPTFLRTVASDSFETECMIDLLQGLFNYSSVALVTTDDACTPRGPCEAPAAHS